MGQGPPEDPQSDFAGVNHEPLGDSLGTQAYIEYFNQLMCGGTPPGNPPGPAFSAEFVAITGSGVLDIFQVGFLKCKNCLGVPQSTVVWFWAYGLNANGPCGPASIHPSPHVIGIAPIGPPPLFNVEKVAGAYHASINGLIYAAQSLSDLETCWGSGSTRRSTVYSEVWDLGQQSGGSNSNTQAFTSVRWKSPTYWYPLTRPLNTDCDVHDRVSQHCHIFGTYTDAYYMWDSRFP